jgi:DNA-binding NtrC family response regulator
MNKGYKILIVDDEEDVGRLLKKQLSQEAYDIDISLGAIDALEKIKQTKYHIVVIDIVMPQMDGIELLVAIKKYDPMTQIIMMTESSTIDRILRSLEYGANDYMLKPIKCEDDLLSMINHSVQKLERWRDAFIQIVQ